VSGAIRVSHYSGCGNDFLIIDDRMEWFPATSTTLIQQLTHTANVDGLILVRKGQKNNFAMKYFNNDGKEASMCGNGLRCFYKFLREKIGSKETDETIEIGALLLEVKEAGQNVRVAMGKVEKLGWNIELDFNGKKWIWHHLNTGVPHIVTFVDDVDAVDVQVVGSFFRNHPQFQPAGTNVNFVDAENMRIRTFERGVEAETLACGTGCTAAGFACAKLKEKKLPIRLQVQSKEHLEIDVVHDKAFMTGPARWIRDGQLSQRDFTLTFQP